MKILLIEDDYVVGDMIAMYLRDENYDVLRIDSGSEGIQQVKEYHPDIIIMDFVLPDANGTEMCTELRSFSSIPIIMISISTNITNRIEALMAGADDFISKPFSMRELLARIIACTRRRVLHDNQTSEMIDVEESVSSIHINQIQRTIYVNGQYVETTYSEYELLRLFYFNPRRVFTREHLITLLGGEETLVNDRSIDVHITKLRKKIEKDPKNPKHIITVWGAGYKFVL